MLQMMGQMANLGQTSKEFTDQSAKYHFEIAKAIAGQEFAGQQNNS